MRTSHGMSGTKTYRAWAHMKGRCTNPNLPVWDHYGGRGITYSPKWRSFESFYADMGECPEGMSLDRIDNDKGYESGNCRWVSQSVQNGNRSKRKNCSSIFRGVYWNKKYGKWRAKITTPAGVKYLGLFDDEADAAIAYNSAAKSLGRPLNTIERIN